jgi:hypothetical protein
MTLTEELEGITMPNDTRREAAQMLQADWSAVRVQFIGWPGAASAVHKDKKETMARSVGAKRLKGATVPKFDEKHPAYEALTAMRTKIRKAWEGVTNDWVEDGKRLIQYDKIDAFEATMRGLRAELQEARDAFAAVYPELVEAARDDNGDLYDPAAYLATFDGQYTFEVDYPSLNPPEALRLVNPALYAEQSARVAAKFDATVAIVEEGFASTLFEHLDFLQRKLQGLDDGTEKRLHKTAIDNLRTFFETFRTLNLHSSAELDRLVEQAEEILDGRNLYGGKPLTKDELRDSQSLRSDVRTRLSAVTASLEGMLTAAPRRALNRRKKAEDAAPTEQE